MSGELQLACAARRDYLAHCAAMLASVIANHEGPVSAHLLVGEDVEEGELEALGAMMTAAGGRLTPVPVGAEALERLAVSDSLPLSHWYWVLLPHLLPGLDRVLYLDCDLIALDSPAPLGQLDLGGRPLGAVTNVFPDSATGAAYVTAIGVKEPRLYFNSGVLALDLDEMRRRDLSRKILEHGRHHPDRGFLYEQDAANAVLAGDWAPMHPRWNLMLGARRFPWAGELFGPGELEAARADPGILHFEGGGANKPWHPDADPGDRETYLRYRERTPWPRLGEGPAGS